MEYRLSNRTLLKSENGMLSSAQPIESTWGDIDYIWVVDEPGTITVEGDPEVKTIDKPGIIIKTYKRKHIPAKLFILQDDNFMNHVKLLQELEKQEENTCCGCCTEANA